MTDIEWYDPPRGAGVPGHWTVEHLVSYHKDTTNAVQRAAEKLARDAEFVLLAHRDTGGAQIKIVHETNVPEQGLELDARDNSGFPRQLDSVVYLISPDEGFGNPERAATSIEFGFQAVKKDGSPGKKVSGVAPLKHALSKSIRERKLGI